MYDNERIRAIISRAARECNDPFCRAWFQEDENGYWEKKVREIFREKADKVASLPRDVVDAEIADFIRLGALRARMSDLQRGKKKRSRKNPRRDMSEESVTIFVDQLDGVEWNVAARRYTAAEVHQGKDRSDIQGEAVGKERYFRAWTNALKAAKKEAQRLLKRGGFTTATVLEGRRVVAHYEAR